jgi:hypothetical protein
MALGTRVPLGLSGAGYDDQNNDAYRNSDGVGKSRITEPSCEDLGHEGTDFEFNLQVFQMQVPSRINKTNANIIACPVEARATRAAGLDIIPAWPILL